MLAIITRFAESLNKTRLIQTVRSIPYNEVTIKSIKDLSPQYLRATWEEACQGGNVHRDPQKPWLATDRPVPDFFKGK